MQQSCVTTVSANYLWDECIFCFPSKAITCPATIMGILHRMLFPMDGPIYQQSTCIDTMWLIPVSKPPHGLPIIALHYTTHHPVLTEVTGPVLTEVAVVVRNKRRLMAHTTFGSLVAPDTPSSLPSHLNYSIYTSSQNHKIRTKGQNARRYRPLTRRVPQRDIRRPGCLHRRRPEPSPAASRSESRPTTPALLVHLGLCHAHQVHPFQDGQYRGRTAGAVPAAD
ncbi:hypothetical protein V8F06_003846 [Rhypophila decipiens]